MISKRLLSKLESGKKYLVSDGIRFLIFEKNETVIWCRELGFPSNGFFGIYMKDWESILRENVDNSDYYHDVKYRYDKTKPSCIYYAHLTHFFASGQVYFSLYDLFFLGEYKSDTDLEKAKIYCNLYHINYRYMNKKERRKNIYMSKVLNKIKKK